MFTNPTKQQPSNIQYIFESSRKLISKGCVGWKTKNWGYRTTENDGLIRRETKWTEQRRTQQGHGGFMYATSRSVLQLTTCMRQSVNAYFHMASALTTWNWNHADIPVNYPTEYVVDHLTIHWSMHWSSYFLSRFLKFANLWLLVLELKPRKFSIVQV